MTDQDQKKPDFSNVVSGSGDSGDSGSGSPDFSNVVSGSSSTAPSSAGSAAGGGERVYVVMKGDSLSKISKMFYGDPNHWKRIFDANRDVIRNADLIQPGWRLRIPE
jgi:nucleoid-associated protein YgaU